MSSSQVIVETAVTGPGLPPDASSEHRLTASPATDTLPNRFRVSNVIAPDDIVVIAQVFLASWTLVCHATVFLRFPFAAAAVMAPVCLLVAIQTGRGTLRETRVEGEEATGGRAYTPRLLAIPVAAGIVLLAYTSHYVAFWSCAAVFLLAACAMTRPPASRLAQISRKAAPTEAVGLVLLAVLAAVVTLACHRPDADDAQFINLAVGVLDHPDWPPLAYDTLHGVPNTPLPVPTYRVHSYELLAAVISQTTGVPVIAVAHILLPLVFAPLSVFAAFVFFTALGMRNRILATALFILLLVLLGGSHRSLGNFAYVRLFQGKSVFVTVLVPLVAANAINWMRRGGWRNWLILGLSQVAGVGLTANALYLAPLASSMALLGMWRWSASDNRRLLVGLLASGYPVAMAIFLSASGQVAPHDVGSAAIDESLFSVLAPGWQRGLLLFTLVGGGLFMPFAWQRRFVYAVGGVAVIVLFNPWLGEHWAAWVTGNINWRLTWAFPWVALAAAVLGEGVCVLPRVFRWPVVLGAGIGLLLLVDDSTLTRRNGTTLKWPDLKVHRRGYNVAKSVVRVAPRQEVLVPENIAIWVVTFRDHPHPSVVRTMLAPYLRRVMSDEELGWRQEAYRYLIGELTTDSVRERTRALIVGGRFGAVVVPRNSANASTMEEMLRQASYQSEEAEGYIIWARPRSALNSARPVDGDRPSNSAPSRVDHHSRRPNILLILTDDHSAGHVGCYGNPDIRTPNLDRFAASGMRFNRMYVTSPQCVPSRASIMTGRSPVGIQMTRFSAPLPVDVKVFPELLRAQGYFAGVAGRGHHLDGSLLPPESQRVFNAHQLKTFPRRLDFAKSGPRTQMIAQLREFLDRVPKGAPFVLQLGTEDPHRPFDKDAVPNTHDPKTLKLPAHFPDTPLVREDFARYYDEIARFDADFSQILDELEQRGLTENTIVIVMGDNGAALLRGKGTLYDFGVRVPFLVRWPGVVRSSSTSDALLSGEDLAPTLMEAAGARAPDSMTGRSFLGLLRGESADIRKYAFAERGAHASSLPTDAAQFDLSRCVISREYKLIYNALWQLPYTPVDFEREPFWHDLRDRHGAGKLPAGLSQVYFARSRPMFELYDLVNDASELNNLAGIATHEAVERELKGALQEWMILERDYVPLPVPR